MKSRCVATKLSDTVKGLLIALVISHWQWDHPYGGDITVEQIDVKSEEVTTA